jgi:hypothetical protein
MQSALDTQLVGQDVPLPLHTKGAQVGVPLDPAGLGLHVPTRPVTLQASQAPPQVLLQHTPSAHIPLVHSLAAEQAVPLFFFGWQVAFLEQKFPVEQSPSKSTAPPHMHELAHLPPEQV